MEFFCKNRLPIGSKWVRTKRVLKVGEISAKDEILTAQ